MLKIYQYKQNIIKYVSKSKLLTLFFNLSFLIALVNCLQENQGFQMIVLLILIVLRKIISPKSLCHKTPMEI